MQTGRVKTETNTVFNRDKFYLKQDKFWRIRSGKRSVLRQLGHPGCSNRKKASVYNDYSKLDYSKWQKPLHRYLPVHQKRHYTHLKATTCSRRLSAVEIIWLKYKVSIRCYVLQVQQTLLPWLTCTYRYRSQTKNIDTHFIPERVKAHTVEAIDEKSCLFWHMRTMNAGKGKIRTIRTLKEVVKLYTTVFLLKENVMERQLDIAVGTALFRCGYKVLSDCRFWSFISLQNCQIYSR